VRALVVVPTRELAHQIYREFRKMSGGRKFRLCVLTKAAASSTAAQAPTTQRFGAVLGSVRAGWTTVLSANRRSTAASERGRRAQMS